jgi:ubiquinone/menaquinone biosynthesis C-methylase UbiE
MTNDARFWDRLARKYAAGPIADEAGYERSLEAARRHLSAGAQVFEFGCGTGTSALKLAPSVSRIVATDLSSEMIAIAREKAAAQGCANVTFEVATLDAPHRSEAAFDAVLGFNVLHLIKDRAGAMRAVHRLLKPGGVFISKTPCLGDANPIYRIAVPLMRAIGKAPNVGFFTAAELEREIADAGFEVIERARHGSKRNDTRPFLVARKR